MHTFTCHVTRRDQVARRVEVVAPNRDVAMRTALAGHPGHVSCRATDQTATVLNALGVRMSPFPLVVSQ